MEEITGKEFYDLLQSEMIEIKNYIVNISEPLIIHINKITTKNSISNCKFNGRLDFFQPLIAPHKEMIHILSFESSVFQDIVINNCAFNELKFNNILTTGKIFSISDCDIAVLDIDKSKIFNQEISFHDNNFNKSFQFKNSETMDSKLSLWRNIFPQSENSFLIPTYIYNCQFFNVDFNKNDFGIYSAFIKTTFTFLNKQSVNQIKDCSFQKVKFNDSSFEEKTNFKDCIFNNLAMFEDAKGLNANIKFRNCRFKNLVSFNNSKIYFLNLEDCNFEDSVFFQNSYFDNIKLDKSIFEKNVFFDDIKIKDIDKCDRRTIQNIKLHLQKTENKIDYNRFRVFEFEAYKVDIKKQISDYGKDKKLHYHRKRQIKNFKRDLFILNITGFVSDYGTDWKRALKFTILFGFLFYIPFFIFENCNNMWDLSNWQIFPIGFLRFFILTDFYSPLKDGRTYIDMTGWNHLFSWLIFILGKIVIAFGIYEMIQAFRKFKA